MTTAARIEGLRSALVSARANVPGPKPSGRVGQIDQTKSAFNVFNSLLHGDGIRAALYALLRRSEYRFIAIFRFRDGMATSCVYVDRENLGDLQAGEVSDTATYCCYIRDKGGPFVTVDAIVDPRTSDHVAKEVVRAYCGVPILTPEGDLIGTLCHYDLVPRDPEQLDIELLVLASSALAQSGLIPPYPVRVGDGGTESR